MRQFLLSGMLWLALLGSSSVSARLYLLSDNYVGHGFLHGFEHQAIEDPTNGRVTYVNLPTALEHNLTFASWDTFIIRTDDKTVLTPADPGRMSVQIRSLKTYTTHVIVLDVRHMPQGCATWPAAWETREADWPEDGEVDIIEGVNDQEPNQSTLHTTAGYTMPENRSMDGTATQLDCNWAVNYNAGCGASSGKANSYGPSFNAAGGGSYAMERNDNLIRVFFWSRNDPSVPYEVSRGSLTINTFSWGIPVALLPCDNCDFSKHFGGNNIIINLTLCGDWAGRDEIFHQAGCPGNCTDYVNNNLEAFKDAYWDIAAVRVYE